MKIFKIYGCNLRKIREYKNISLKELSAKTKIREIYLKKIENGEAYGLTTTKIFVIAETLDESPHMFLDGM